MDPALEAKDGPGYSALCTPDSIKSTNVEVPAQQRKPLGMQRNLHVPLYHIKTPILWLILSVLTPDLALA